MAGAKIGQIVPIDASARKSHEIIKGGIAPNVIPPEAEAEMMFRTVGDHAVLRRPYRRARQVEFRLFEVGLRLQYPEVRIAGFAEVLARLLEVGLGGPH